MQIQTTDNASPAMAALAAALGDAARLHKVCALGALPVLQKHLRQNAGRNRNPYGVRGGFWNRMLSGTRAESDGSAGYLRMPSEVALRYFGGTVQPKGGAKNLAIPARAEAYGKSPRDVANLRFIMFASGTKALEERDTKLIFYWLTPSATIRPDRSLLPETETLQEASVDAVGYWLKTTVPA